MENNFFLGGLQFFIASLTLLLGIFVLQRGVRHPVNRYYFYFSCAVVFWLFTNGLVQLAAPEWFVFWVRSTFLAAALVMLSLVEFILIFPKPISEYSRYLRIISLVSGFAISFLALGDLLVASGMRADGVDKVVYGPLFPVFLLYVVLFFLTVIFILNWHLRRAIGSARGQILYLAMGIFLASVFAIATDLIAPLLGNELLPNYGPIGVIALAGFTAYAIIAHRLFDIRVIVRKTVIYSGLLSFVIGTYSLIIFTLGSLFGTTTGVSRETFLPNLIAALVVAFGFDPIRKWLVAATDKYLFVGEYKPEDVLRELSKTLSGVIDLDEALQGLMQTLVKAMRMRRAATFVLRRYKEGVEVKRVKEIGFGGIAKLKLEKNDPLIAHFESRFKGRRDQNERRHFALVTEELSRRIEEGGRVPPIVGEVHKRLTALGAAVALPLVVKDQLIGILILSEKLSGDIFTTSDLDLLEIVAHETAGAIEKARFWEEDQLKSEFVSIASHELLTPTSTIQGYLSMILDEGMGKVDPKAREYLERVRVTSKRLTELVQDLLNVSRIEGGRIKITPQPMDLLLAIRQVVEELTPQANTKGLSLHFEDPARQMARMENGELKMEKEKKSQFSTLNSQFFVFADPERVRQILVNIIGNAVKYTPRGGVTVSVAKGGRVASLAVSDTGVGMSPEDRKHLFEKFYRIQNEHTQGITGTGLGLYITKNIIELMGGKIEVASSIGRGSTFTVAFPLTTQKPVAPPPVALSVAGARAAHKPPKMEA